MGREFHTHKNDKLWKAQYKETKGNQELQAVHCLEFFLDIYCLDKREITCSESRDYMEISDKGMTKYLTLSTKSTKNKQNTRTYITTITNHDFRKFLKDINNSPYLGYKKKQVYNEPTEA